jgi:hypothetical protein
MEFQNISFNIVLLLLIQTVWIVAFFAVLQHIVIRMVKNNRWHDWLAFYTPLIRNVVWVLFVIKVIYTFGNYQPILTLFITGVTLALTWTIIRDFVQGTIFRFQKGDIVGQEVKLENYKGVVLKMGETKLSIELNNGEVVQFPYQKLFTEVLIKPITNKQIKVETFLENLPAKVSIEDLKKQLTIKALSSPWVVIKSGVSVEVFNDELDHERKVKVSYSITSPSKSLLIQDELRKYISQVSA